MSDHDDLDRRLQEAGARWRSDQGAPGLDAHEVADLVGRRRHRWVAPLAVAAAVALLAGGAAVLADRLDDGTAPGPATDSGERWDPDLPPGLLPAEVPGAVPPVNQPVSFPAAEVAGAFTPALTDVVGEPACGADDLDWGLTRGDGDGEVVFRLAAARADVSCVLSRYPYLEHARDGEPVEVLARTPDPRAGDWPASVLVAPERPAVLRTTWAGWCGTPPFDEVKLFLDDTEKRLEIAGAVTGCTGDPADLPDRVLMTGWEPETWSLDPPADFSGLRAVLLETLEGPGGLPTWVVELTSPRDLDLGTCPTWEVRQGEEESASWRLNCGGVRTKRPDGTPYLPAGRPVRFAIWASYGGSEAALTWVLRTPDGMIRVPLSEGPEAPTGEPRLVAEQDANLHFLVSNQSFEQPDVRLALTIDGVELVDEDFAVEGQHNYEQLHVALAAGEHTVELTSDTGARLVRTVTVPARGDRWVMASYRAETARDDTGTFDWLFQDSPIGIA
jgi:hypothetical protein